MNTEERMSGKAMDSRQAYVSPEIKKYPPIKATTGYTYYYYYYTYKYYYSS